MPILPKPIELTPELEVGFWKRVPKGSPEQCWEWAGCLTAGGYGKMHHQKRGYMAHRLSVLIDSRELPDGMFVDHICRNRSCVNPLHLRVVTSAVNTLENSDSVAAVNAQKTHCDNGHEFSPRNTRTRHRDGRTMRVCRKCLVIDKRNHRHRKGAAMRAALPSNATTNASLVEALADYFTGSNVAAASIGLQLGGHSKVLADAFFKVRNALGITGYANRDEALATLRASNPDEEGKLQ